MAKIIPFRGYRYNPDAVGSITDVVAPPYDRVYPDVQEERLNASPFNIVRVIKGLSEANDSSGNNVYTRAAEYLEAWLGDNTLIREDEPAIYAYHQTYEFAGQQLTRKGVIALGKLEPERVHAHEKTLRGPREDRLNLMRATEANFGHIFMLYNDPERTTENALGNLISSETPIIEAKDADGNLHQVWRITDEQLIGTVQEALSDKDLYIADGHHRYETAVNFMQECEQAGWTPAADESFGYRMMTLFNVSEPGMSIRPIFRLVHGVEGFDADAFLQAAEERFEVTAHETFEEMAAATHAGRTAHTVGCFTSAGFHSLQIKNLSSMDELIPDRSVDYRQLDVSILHAGILEPLLGIDAKALEEQKNVTYTVDPKKGISAVKQGDEQIFFFMNSTAADEVIRVADHGEKMPQKSTDFYPKLLTGLVLTKMEIAK